MVKPGRRQVQQGAKGSRRFAGSRAGRLASLPLSSRSRFRKFGEIAMRTLGLTMLALAATIGAGGTASAQSNPAYVHLGPVNAAKFVPDRGPAPHIAFVTAHRTGNT